MKYNDAKKSIKGYGKYSMIKNDSKNCLPLAISNATRSAYDSVFEFCSTVLERNPKKGVSSNKILSLDGGEFKIGNKKATFHKLSKDRITNTYHLKGEDIARKKTVKSFIKDNPKGTFIVLVSKHTFTLRDGTVYDHEEFEFQPTRKVVGVLEVEVS